MFGKLSLDAIPCTSPSSWARWVVVLLGGAALFGAIT